MTSSHCSPGQPAAAPLPPSPTSLLINSLALLASLAAAWWLAYHGRDWAVRTEAVVLVCLALALPIILLEWWWLKPHRNPSAGLALDRPPRGSVKRTATKLLGFYACIGGVALVYWLLPEYRGNFYGNYFALVQAVLPWWLLIAVPYFYWLDARMAQPKDGYWQLGRALLGRRADADAAVLGQLALGWLVKLFFLPLMFAYLGNNLNVLLNTNPARVLGSFQGLFDFTFNFLYYIDLLFVTVGYVCTIRLFDAHIRSSEPSFLGWAVALMCYQPFWSMFSGNYLHYDQGPAWGHWFWGTPFYGLWGMAILALIGIYVWASVAFGIRFSNLTHRGILSNGPFRYTKHPAYVSKNLSWWLVSMPFMVSASASDSLRHCLLLLLLNGIYFLRARTEERHLSRDPAYVAYAAWIERHGIFARLGRWVPALRFKPGRLLSGGSSA